MKIKQSKSFDNKTIAIIFSAMTVVAVALRMYHITNLIDASTGFYKSKDFTVYILYAILALGSIAIAVISYINGNVLPKAFPENKSKTLGIISVLCTISMFFDSGFSLISAATADAAGVGTGNLNSFRALMKTGALPLMFQSFVAIFAAIYFIILASSYFGGKCKFRNHKVLALMPVCWGVLRMIRRFVRQISFVNVSDLLLELVMISLLLLFFMAFAQMASGVYDEGTRWRLAGFGLPAASFCIVTSLPRLIFVIIGQSGNYINEYHPLYPCDLLLAIFIIAVVFLKVGAPMQTASEATPAEDIKGE